jgi:quercetin dioxygenase-like cupin family protein
MSDPVFEPQVPGMFNAMFRPSISPEETKVPRFLSWREITKRKNKPKDHGTWGYQRISYGAMEATNSRTNIFFLPAGQQTPIHSSLIEHIITGLAGQVEWTVNGEEFVMGYLDQLFMPANAIYTCRNIGFDTASVLSVLSPDANGWPSDDAKVVFEKLD